MPAHAVTLHVAVSYPDGGTPPYVSWSGGVPWPSLPRPRDAWVCCPAAVYRARFEDVSFRGPNATEQQVLITSTVPSAQAAHLQQVHGFTAAAALE